LRSKSIEELRAYSIRLENYVRFKTPGFLGGVHDYIMTMDADACIKYILSVIMKNPELADEEKFFEVILTDDSVPVKIDDPKVIYEPIPVPVTVDPLPEPTPILGGLHDFIFREPREKLIKWALATEQYHRRVNNLTLLGGLDDYVDRLSDAEVAQYILKEADEHKELDNLSMLENIAQEFNIVYYPRPAPGFLAPSVKVGAYDFVFTQSRDTLITWALTTEKHDREARKLEHIFGGLDDYVDQLSNEELIDYVINQLKAHRDIASPAKLNELAVKYEIVPKSQ